MPVTTSSAQRALDRASVLGGSAAVRWMHGGMWRVRGTRGKYTVSTFGTTAWRTWRCTCEAGRRGLLTCRHRGCVFMAQLRDQAGKTEEGK